MRNIIKQKRAGAGGGLKGSTEFEKGGSKQYRRVSIKWRNPQSNMQMTIIIGCQIMSNSIRYVNVCVNLYDWSLFSKRA